MTGTPDSTRWRMSSMLPAAPSSLTAWAPARMQRGGGVHRGVQPAAVREKRHVADDEGVGCAASDGGGVGRHGLDVDR